MKAINKLRLNYLKDITSLSEEEREKQIRLFMKSEHLTYRELADMIQVPHTTIFGWLNKEKVDEQKKAALIKSYEKEVKAYNFSKGIVELKSYLVRVKDIELSRLDKENIRILILRLSELLG